MEVKCNYCDNEVESLVYIENRLDYGSDLYSRSSNGFINTTIQQFSEATISNPKSYLFGACESCLNKAKEKLQKYMKNEFIKNKQSQIKFAKVGIPIFLVSFTFILILNILSEKIGWYILSLILFLSIIIGIIYSYSKYRRETNISIKMMDLIKSFNNSDFFILAINFFYFDDIKEPKSRVTHSGIFKKSDIENFTNIKFLKPINIKNLYDVYKRFFDPKLKCFSSSIKKYYSGGYIRGFNELDKFGSMMELFTDYIKFQRKNKKNRYELNNEMKLDNIDLAPYFIKLTGLNLKS
jgi:hypothetical protein